MSTVEEPTTPQGDADEQRLRAMGYEPTLERSLSGFSNFAISFSIVSILTGGLASYQIGLLNGGPITMAWGWPLVSVMVLFVGLAMAELASAYPTAGGLYWWASKLGKPAHGWFTGWFNLVGQVAVTAAIVYGSAIFVTAVLDVLGLGVGTDRTAIFVVFTVLLLLHAGLNIIGPQISARVNMVSAWWHVAGVAIFVLVLAFFAHDHQSFKFVFTKTVDQSGVGFGGVGFSFLLGLLHAQYTFTGYDASAHMSEETKNASTAVAKGIINTILVSAVFGYVLILAVTFAIPSLDEALKVSGDGGYPVIYILQNSLDKGLSDLLLIIAAVAQLFCGYASITAASRMAYAFSRDKAVPGSRFWSTLTARRVPAAAVGLVVVFAWILLIPSLLVAADKSSVAYAAATSIAVIGLYISYAIPIWLRLKHGKDFETGDWSLGSRYRVIGGIAIAWIVLICVLFVIPTSDAGLPWQDDFTWSSVNYAPVTVVVVLGAVGIWWMLSARKWFTGPLHTVSEIEEELDA
ncbi:amino acid permease [Patulibacter minatonensis]|uniref:amino acid permease n=1 Tax=Patulibacter minatonensis TaxID=298163 RepID=UPI00047B9B9C|nr:amino acid permease [Patulibacter minatonensis]